MGPNLMDPDLRVPDLMPAVVARKAGGPEVLEVTELPTPRPGPGEVLIRHAAIGLNFIDTYHRSGLYPVTFPLVLGTEASGTVEAVGPGVARFRPGDRVAYAPAPSGAYAAFSVRAADRVVLVPASIPLELAAAALLKGMTAEFLLRRTFHVKQGDAVLVHAAAGGVGSILVQWAKALGAEVIATAGSPAKLEIAQRHGADHLLLSEQPDLADRVREITGGRGVPVVYDSIGKTTFEASLSSLARRGLMVAFGNASGPPPTVDPIRLMRGGSLFLTRPTLFDYVATTEELDASAAALFDVLGAGQVKVEIGQSFPLADARAAHEALEGRRTTGSTVLVP
jgi:NADPH2:quinone reductase